MITNKPISLTFSLPFETRLDLIAHIKRIQYKKGKKKKGNLLWRKLLSTNLTSLTSCVISYEYHVPSDTMQ